MALPVLDGNQSATTLSSVVTGGEHIVAHTVVSLGSNAIANITSAVSGSVVSVSNFPATQTVAGTVTANVGTFPSPIISQIVDDSLSLFGLPNNPFCVQGNGPNSSLPISGTVTVGNTVTVAGTVTANLNSANLNDALSYFCANTGELLPVSLQGVVGNVPVSGTVTVGNTVTIAGTVTANPAGTQTVAGTVTANLNIGSDTFPAFVTPINNWNPYESGDDSLNINIKNIGTGVNAVGSSLPISGTVTANNPNGALTTRFGSVATANLATLTSAVTNNSRKFLLVQNIATSTVTIGIGFSPTTTQGIQLSAGGGLTFDAFCPTGGVWWLSSTTGSNFSILEG